MNVYKTIVLGVGLLLAPMVALRSNDDSNAGGSSMAVVKSTVDVMFWVTALQGLRFDTILNTCERVDFADSLRAKNEAQFKKKLISAARRQMHNM